MKILIIGAGGMVGQKLVHKLLEPNFNAFSIDEICLFDLYLPKYRDTRIRSVIGTVENSEILKEFSSERFGLIFYLASVVSGEAEENFEKGWNVNLFSMWNFLSALKVEHLNSYRKYIPKVIFTSSIAVFGAPFPDRIDDEFLCSPQTSYGAQKASIEILISDFSRKGFISGVSLRLPTICVRPGKPNKAASGFFSNILIDLELNFRLLIFFSFFDDMISHFLHPELKALIINFVDLVTLKS